nr:MAG TPA: hypothetical protein [Caudoviricetes sp.]
MDLGKMKFAKFDKETGKYKEIDPVNILTKPVTKTEISAETTLNKETEKSLFGNSEEALSALQQELKEESDAIRGQLRVLMRLYDKKYVDLRLPPHGLRLRITREQLERNLSDVEKCLLWVQVESLRIDNYTEKYSYEAAVMREFKKVELRTKFVMLAIAKRFGLLEIGCGRINGQVIWYYKVDELEQELSGDDDLTNEVREQVEKRFHCKLK